MGAQSVQFSGKSASACCLKFLLAVPVREERKSVNLRVVKSCTRISSGNNSYMVCGCKEHCIPSIEEAAKISSLVAPPIYLLKSQKYHIWYDPRCSPRSTHVPRHHADTTTTTTTTHDIDTTIELQRKHYTRARKVHNRRCSTSPLKNNN